MGSDGLRIGEVAQRAGVNIQTLRYYERRGLLREPPRRPSGYRAYAPETVRVVRFIKRAQKLGFSLREVRELLGLRVSQRASCAQVRARARAKMAEIEGKIAGLQAIREALEALVASCTREGSTRECPILDAIERTSAAGEP